MIGRIDLPEIKKLVLFLIVLIVATLLFALGLNRLHIKDSPVVRKQLSMKPRMAVDNKSQKDAALKMENYELYQLRDPFAPISSPDMQENENENPLASGISEPLPKVLKVYVEDGKEKAKIDLNGDIVVLGEDQKFGNFYVINILSKAKKVIFIYGDEKITVSQKAPVAR